MALPTNCALCGKTLKYNTANPTATAEGLPLTNDTHDCSAKSEMHYAHCGHRRARQQFNQISDENWKAMRVENKNGSLICCYECHEVVCHNPVFSESQLAQLARLFFGKSFEDRVVLLNRIIELGLQEMSVKQYGAG